LAGMPLCQATFGDCEGRESVSLGEVALPD
jgi:hypothetical protein